jgi:hypothetical protein
LGTTVPTIDAGRCCCTVENSVPKTDINVYVSGGTSTDIGNTCSEFGCFAFSPAIPANQCVILDLCARTTLLVGSGSATAQLWCKGSGDPLFTRIVNHTNLNSQPLNGAVTVRSGDQLAYCLTATATSVGAEAVSTFRMTNAAGSFGVTPTIGSPSGSTISKIQASKDVIVSICCQNDFATTGCAWENGYVNVEPFLQISTTECVKVCYNVQAFASRDTVRSYLRLYCKRTSDTGYSIFATYDTDLLGPKVFDTGEFFKKPGDVVCYCMDSGTNGVLGSTNVAFQITDAIGYNGVNAEINSDVDKELRTISASDA